MAESRIFNEEGLLKKHVLRGSSLRGKFQELADKAGVDDMKFTHKGFQEATDQIKTYRAAQLADALDLNERVGNKEADKAKTNVQKITQESKKEWQDWTAKRLRNTGVGYGAQGQADHKKVQDAAKLYEGKVEAANAEIESLEKTMNEANENLQDWKTQLNRKVQDYRSLSALDNFTDAYLSARKNNIGREELLSRLGSGAGSKSAQLQNELDKAVSANNATLDEYNKVVANKDKLKGLWDKNRDARWGMWRGNFWPEAMAAQGGKYLTKGFQDTPGAQAKYEKLAKEENKYRPQYWQAMGKVSNKGAEAIRSGYDVEAWRIQADNEKAGMEFV